MRDTDFQESPLKSIDPGGSFNPPNSKLAVVSLVFGILGLLVLPLIGPIIAIATGHLALGEIRSILVVGIFGLLVLPLVGPIIAITTGHLALGEIRTMAGRLGGRSMAKAGLIMGYVALALIILVGIVASLFFGQSVEQRIVSSPAVVRKSGVKMRNEMSQNDLFELRRLQLRPDDKGQEEVICFYNDSNTDDGEPEMAVLTNRRIVYFKGTRLTSFDLKDIDSVLDNGDYKQKYTPNHIDSSQYRIEIKRESGGRMRIIIKPALDGPAFYQALLDAWKAAGGKPAEKKSS